MTKKLSWIVMLLWVVMPLEILKSDDKDNDMDDQKPPSQSEWKHMVIPSVELNSSFNEGIDLIEKIAKKAGAEELGFRQLKVIQTPLIQNESRKLLDMKLENVPFSKLIDIVSDLVGGTWDSSNGVVVITPYMSPEEFYFNINKNILRGLNIPDNKEVSETDLVTSLNKFEVVSLESFNIEIDTIRGDKLVFVSGTKREIRFVKSVIIVLSKGLYITKTR